MMARLTVDQIVSAFRRRLLDTINRMGRFNPVGLAVTQNAPLEAVLDELRPLEDDGLIVRTEAFARIEVAHLHSEGAGLRPEVCQLDGEDIDRARIYAISGKWTPFYRKLLREEKKRCTS